MNKCGFILLLIATHLFNYAYGEPGRLGTGEATLTTFSYGQPRATFSGPFQIAISKTHLGLKLFESGPDIERKIWIVTDYSDIYQSEIFWQYSGLPKGIPVSSRPKNGWASVNSGIMPNAFSFGWGMPQAFFLALHVVNLGDASLKPDGSSLKEEFQPDHVTRTASAISRIPYSCISRDEDGNINRIKFYGAPHANAPQNPNQDPLVAELYIISRREGLPEQIVFTNYGYAPKDLKTPLKYSEYIFTIREFTPLPQNAFQAIAYDADMPVAVQDRRYNTKHIGYQLKPHNEPPLKGNKSFQISETEAKTRAAAESTELRKKILIYCGMIGTFVGLTTISIYYRRKSKTQNA